MPGQPKPGPSPSLLRTFWLYRWLFVAALVLGTLLWFILINSQPVTVYLPFGIGRPTASIGLIVLVSAAVGAFLAVVTTAVVLTLRHYRRPVRGVSPEVQVLPDDRPPPDYAAKTPEGFSDAPWSAR
jgi:uncharacterized integral membrane protein